MKKLKLPSYGGQALIEGVMMRGSHFVAAAFRAPSGEILIQNEDLSGIYQSKIKNIPFIRGFILLWDSLVLGTRYLTIAANTQTGSEEKIEGPVFYVTMLISIGLAIGLFFVLPAAMGQWIAGILKWNAWWSNLLEGVIRLVLIIGYIWSVGKIPDIQRVFSYHGAEHKTINAFESGAELTPATVMQYSLEHPRCGTAFLLTIAVLSILFFSLLGPLPVLWRLISRVVLIPVLVGLSYEYIRWTSNHLESPIVRFLIRPNLALQHLTTRQPDLGMLEVAIAAFNTMYALENSIPLNPINLQQPVELVASGADDYQNQQK
ncbi:MAG: DUF1385 domain-containing protein [Anaerolineaceae bacterium]|nr:DUF1385 domain-containing protein [Anaerolineaceae bacterium]